jgi:hypothetical protein
MRAERILVLALVFAATAAAEGIRPGVNNICVPSEDGKRWVCGTADDPPPERGLPPPEPQSESAPPPPFLAAPSAPVTTEMPQAPQRVRRDEFPAIRREVAPPEPVAEPVVEAPTEPVAESSVESVAEPIEPTPIEAPAARTPAPVETTSASSAPPPFLAAAPRQLAPFAPSTPAPASAPVATVEPAPQSAVSEPESRQQPSSAEAAAIVAEPAPAPIDSDATTSAADPAMPETPAFEMPVESAAQVENEVASEPFREPDPEPEPAVARTIEPTATELPSQAPEIALRSAEEFLALPAGAYTVQIGRTEDTRALADQAYRLGLSNQSDLYAIALDAGATRQWLLLWSRFDSLAAARSAIAALPANGGVSARRIGPLQAEARRSAGARPDVAALAASAPADAAIEPVPAANDLDAFLALAASSYTVQLARASDSSGFDALLVGRAIDPQRAFRIAIDAAGNRTWLLLLDVYPDLAGARAAARAASGGAWPRRIGPLQEEVRRARSAR